MEYGKRIKDARNKSGLTQKQLGERLGVSESAVAQYESGQRVPKVDTLQRPPKGYYTNTPIISKAVLPSRCGCNTNKEQRRPIRGAALFCYKPVLFGAAGCLVSYAIQGIVLPNVSRNLRPLHTVHKAHRQRKPGETVRDFIYTPQKPRLIVFSRTKCHADPSTICILPLH